MSRNPVARYITVLVTITFVSLSQLKAKPLGIINDNHNDDETPEAVGNTYQASFCNENKTLQVPFYENRVVKIPCPSETFEDIVLYKGSPQTSLELISGNETSPWRNFSLDQWSLGSDDYDGFVFTAPVESANNQTLFAGTFTCLFANKAMHSYTSVELFENADSVFINKEPCVDVYLTNCTESTFTCEGNGDIFDETTFQWFFRTTNGRENITSKYSRQKLTDKGWIGEQITINFPSTEITGVDCQLRKKNSKEWSNAVVNVTVEDWDPPAIISSSTETVKYSDGLELRCEYSSTCDSKTVHFWRLNGSGTEGLSQVDSKGVTRIYPRDSSKMQTYTCEVGIAGDEYSFVTKTYLVTPEVDTPFDTVSSPIDKRVIAALTLLWLVSTFVGFRALFQRYNMKEKRLPTKPSSILEQYNLKITNMIKVLEDRNTRNWQPNYKNPVRILGEGKYAILYLVRDKVTDQLCVIKSSKHMDSLSPIQSAKMCIDTIQEAEIVASLQPHPNIVRYLGFFVKSMQHHQFYPILDYYKNGSLRCLLDSHVKKLWDDLFNDEISPAQKKQHGFLCGSDLMRFLQQIAAAMEYLETKGIVHRDLAARNILLDEDSNGIFTAVLCDFGMARRVNSDSSGYTYMDPAFCVNDNESDDMKPRFLPILWYAPEALGNSARYTTKSDVWSFAVLAWEIFAVTKQPYDEFCLPRDELLESVDIDKFKELLEKQEISLSRTSLHRCLSVPDDLWELMEKCWLLNGSGRPSFADIHAELKQINDDFDASGCLINNQLSACNLDLCEQRQSDSDSYAQIAFNYIPPKPSRLINQPRYVIKPRRTRRVTNNRKSR